MKPLCRFAVTISALIAITVLAELPAQRKGGGGKTSLAGTVYFSFDGSTWTMDPDGKNKKRLLPGVAGEPSYALHDGKRWFLTIQLGELFAIADDGQLQVRLTDPADGVSPGLALGLPRWAKDDPSTTSVDEADSFVGYVGADSAGITSIYRMPVSWHLNAPVSDGPSTAVLANIVSEFQIIFDWSPDGDQLVHDSGVQGSVKLHVFDLVSSQSRVLVTGGSPHWSPDGATIMFNAWDKTYIIRTIQPDGTGAKTILRGHGGKILAVVQPRWSPSSTHIVYLRTGAGGGQDPDIFRATSGGGSKTNLTEELVTSFLGRMVTPVGWR